MSEREMLENAARAAGLTIIGESPGGWVWVKRPGEEGYEWSPPDNNGDAFQLAAMLGIDVTHLQIAVEIVPTGDPYAATRLAITRAAAEIGAAMKEPTP